MNIHALQPRLLDTETAATYLGMQPGTLENWRYLIKGPKPVRLGGRAIRYDIKDLDAWIDGLKDAA